MNKPIFPIYARIVKGEVVEYPLTLQQIQARETPMRDFSTVTFEDSPPPEPFKKIVEKIKLVGETPVVYYELEPFDFQEILDQLWNFSISRTKKIGGHFYKFTSQEAANHLFYLITEELEKRLQTFSDEKSYKSIDVLCSYVNDPFERFSEEGRKGLKARSEAWKFLVEFRENIETNKVQIPKTKEELFDLIPTFSWE